MSDAVLLGYVMLAAYSETQLDLGRQQAQRTLIEEADEGPTGRLNLHGRLSSKELENKRFEAGRRAWWYESHCQAKRKGFKGWR